MRHKSILKVILLNICVILSIACFIIKILDWYNPYMDFYSHSFFIQYLLYSVVIMLFIFENVHLKGK